MVEHQNPQLLSYEAQRCSEYSVCNCAFKLYYLSKAVKLFG